MHDDAAMQNFHFVASFQHAFFSCSSRIMNKNSVQGGSFLSNFSGGQRAEIAWSVHELKPTRSLAASSTASLQIQRFFDALSHFKRRYVLLNLYPR